MSLSFHHTLKHNRSTARFSNLVFFDVESKVATLPDNRQVFEPILWCAIHATYSKGADTWTYSQNWGTDISAFWDWAVGYAKQSKTLYLVSHHIEVDFVPLDGFNQLRSRGFTLTKFIAKDRVTIMFWACGKRKIIVLNNGNIFDGSIEQWGRILGIEKLPMPAEDEPLEIWIEYCMRDTEIVAGMWRYLYTFLNEHDLGCMKYTKASLAFTAYRHRFMSHEICIHNNPHVIKLERESYHGGRFQACAIGQFPEQEFYLLDINSMYAHIEITGKLPYRLVGYKSNPDKRILTHKLGKYALIAEVEVSVNEPILPIKKDDKIVYVRGKHRVTLTSPELEYVKRIGKIHRIYQIAWYDWDYIMKDFAEYFTRLKERYTLENNQPMRQLTKIYPNALYGKFAQRGYKDEVIGTAPKDEIGVYEGKNIDTGERFQYMVYNGKVHRESMSDVSENALVAIASFITAYGRVMLWDYMKAAGLENVFHVATDSLLVNRVGLERLKPFIDPVKTGALKLEKEGVGLVIRDVNDYDFAGQTKIKGVNRKGEKLGEDTYRITAWTRLKTVMKSGELSVYFTRLVTKTLKRPQYKLYLQTGKPLRLL